jgi:exopolysaccharide biosynthesis polyprenyl glycosylphosphotransferase
MPATTSPLPSAHRRDVSPRSLRRGLVIADAVALLLGFIAAFVLQEVLRPVPLWIQLEHLLLTVVAVPVWLVAMGANKLYMSRVIERPSEEVQRLVASGAIGVGAMVALAFVLQYGDLSRLWIITTFVFVTVSLAIERRIARKVFAKLRQSGRISRRVAIIGTDAHAIGLLHTVQRNPGLGYDVIGFIGNDDLGQRGGKTVLGTLDHAEEILREHGCVGAMISLNSVNAVQVNRLTRTLTDQGFHIALSTSLRDIDVTRMRPQVLDGQTLIYVEPTIRTGWRGDAKRVFDVAVASLGLLLSAPFIGCAALLVRLESDGPAFFRQERVGRNGEKFQMIKLRTMHIDAEERKAELMSENEMDGPLFKIERDPRITRVGRLLRKLSIDELPQFWNVIKGEMSVVGPRPALPDEVAQWEPELHDRLRVLPGITGLWQVSGRSGTGFDEYKRLDLYYVDNWSLLHDLRIVTKTVGTVLLQRGAS